MFNIDTEDDLTVRLVSDPSIGVTVTNNSLVINARAVRHGPSRKNLYCTLQVFDAAAEHFQMQIKKNSLVRVVGLLYTNEYRDREGKQKSDLVFKVKKFSLLEE